MTDPRIIVALDFADAETALAFARRLEPGSCRLKVGKELFVSAGPALVRELRDLGFEIFLDLKFHDIPNTVNRACAAAARLGVWMMNVHALGGAAMLRAAREGVESVTPRPLLIGVTVLTSTSQQDLGELGIERSLDDFVGDLAALSVGQGLDGVVCSAREAGALRERLGAGPLLVTPGIRPEWATGDDQHRIVTPAAAIAAGASYLVIGRPITRHAEPVAALAEINASLA